ncbi:MAG TPA: hypothetical protein VF391_03100 [Dermatophilaceae bacterium]|jgi:hypothetical protein
MGLFTRRAPGAVLPPAVVTALELAKGERVLAFGVDDKTGGYVVATTFALAVVILAPRPSTANTPHAESSVAVSSTRPSSTAERTLRRRWLSVDAGAWEPGAGTLTVTWADGGRGVQWSFQDQETRLPEVLRERVQASVVIATRLTLGDRRSGRVAIRQDFATRELIQQTILGRYTHADDPEVQAHVQAAQAHLRDQVGLPA